MSIGFSENLLRGVFIRAARSVLGLSLKEVGEQVKVTAGAVGKWENNEAPIKDTIYEDLKHFFEGNGVSVDLSDEEHLIVKIDKHALSIIQDCPRNPVYQTLNDMAVAKAQKELDELFAKFKPDGKRVEQDSLLAFMDALSALTGGKLLHFSPDNQGSSSSSSKKESED